MIAALDSSFDAPTLAQAQAARAAGVRAWGGYLATVQREGAFGLAAPWSRAAFANVQQADLRAIAFCSGWDDPVALRQLAAEWNVLLFLDDEDEIRRLTEPDWRPAFLSASGAGLYGLLARHNIAAPYRIVADYPTGGCTDATWSTSPAPAEPHGWQCQGTHRDPATGLSVDSMRLDDWFGGDTMTPEEHAWLQWLYTVFSQQGEVDPQGNPISCPTQITYTWAFVRANTAAVLADLKELLADFQTAPPGSGLTPAQIQLLTESHDAVLRLEGALQKA